MDQAAPTRRRHDMQHSSVKPETPPDRPRNDRFHSGGNGPDRSRRFDFALKALSRTPISLFYQKRDLVFAWVENPPAGMGEAAILGHRDGDFLPAVAAQRLVDAKMAAMETGTPQRLEVPVRFENEVRWFDVWIDPDRDEKDAVTGVFSAMMETTAQKRREVQLRALLREVSHRSKNLLAIVLSLATQTARHSLSISAFVTAFSGRLQAIARAQDLVTDRDWQGASLNDLIVREVALFRGVNPLTVRVSGADRLISPSAALYIGLAIHELAVHASRITVAGNEPIVVSILRAANDDEDDAIVLDWRVSAGTRGSGFDSLQKRFLETVVPLAVDGQGSIDDDGKSLSYRLSIGSHHLG